MKYLTKDSKELETLGATDFTINIMKKTNENDDWAELFLEGKVNYEGKEYFQYSGFNKKSLEPAINAITEYFVKQIKELKGEVK